MIQKNDRTKLLIVEDDPAQRMLLRLNLKGEEYDVLEAENGLEALEKFAGDPELRLMITDLMMPECDGFELIKTIRQKEMQYTYIIVLTANEERDTLLRALSLGADDFLTKPVYPDELRLRLKGGKRLLQLESQKELITSMAKMADYRSEETGYHLERVSHYSRLLAKDLSLHHPELDITINMAEEIATVSPLHDIGKVAIPDNILKKPGALTDEEFAIMKTHAPIGGKLIREIYDKTGTSYLRLAYEIAMFHHEKFNGKGYPLGLAGDDIPVAARIMTLADIYDAMTSTRCYKESWPHEKVKKIIVQERGEQLDPRVVDAFLRQEEHWLQVKASLQDIGSI